MLTQVQIRLAKPKAKPYRLADGRGLNLLVHPGGGKYWQIRTRINDKEKLISLGVYPELGLIEAREKFAEVRKQLRAGIVPPLRRRPKGQSVCPTTGAVYYTFETVALQWFELWKKGKDEDTAAYKLRRMKSDLFPTLGPLDIKTVTRKQVIEAIRLISARGVGDTARRALQVCKAILSYSVTHEYRDSSPIAELSPTDIMGRVPTKHYARIEERELPHLLSQIFAYEGLITRYAVLLMCLTFVRTGTLRKARWGEIDFQNKRWNIPAAHMKKVGGIARGHVVPLSTQAIEVLRALETLTDGEGYVVSGDKKGSMMSDNTILRALERMGFKGKMTGHGFRGLASTILHENGFDHIHIERQLAHQERNESSAPYNFAEFLTQRQAMMQWWGDYLDRVRLEGSPS